MGLRAVAKVKVSRAGGSTQLIYICRSEALKGDQRREEQNGKSERETERSANLYELDGEFHKGKLPASELERDTGRESSRQPKKTALPEHIQEDKNDLSHQAEAVWTWNAPAYVTGDRFGTRPQDKGREGLDQKEAGRVDGQERARQSESKTLTLDEKVENACAYFGLLSDSEKRRGGVNSFRIVLTIGGAASNQKMNGAVHEFLRQGFPSAQALVAIHRDTMHVHAHLYVHSRQLDGKKIDLKQDYFKLDEKWAEICAERFHDQSIYEEHLRLKAQTRAYRREESRAREVKETLPAKPDRWSDRFDIVHGTPRPWDDRFVGRLMASTRLAEVKAEYLKVITAPESQVREADREAQELKSRLQSVSDKRALARSPAKRSMPGEVVTVEEQRAIAQYTAVINEKVSLKEGGFQGRVVATGQASFDFEESASQQFTLDFDLATPEKIQDLGTSNPGIKSKGRKQRSRTADSTERRGKSENATRRKVESKREGKAQSKGNKQNQTMDERVILGRALMAQVEVTRLDAELARAREHGDKWGLRIYDATHRRERIISEFEIRRRCEVRAKQSVYREGETSRTEIRLEYQRELDKELAKHKEGIATHREIVNRSIHSLEKSLTAAQQENEFYRPQALEIQDQYAIAKTQPPLPHITVAELNNLQEQAIAAKDSVSFLAQENIRERLAGEGNGSIRTDYEFARLHGQHIVARSEHSAHERRGDDFERARHLASWKIDGESWSLAEVDQQLDQLQDRARLLNNPQALIPQVLSPPVREAARLVRTLSKNLNLSSSKRDKATDEINRLIHIREKVEGQIKGRSELLQSEIKNASNILQALGEVFKKEVSRGVNSGRQVPTPVLMKGELNRLEANAQLTKDASLIKPFHALEAEHFQRETGGDRRRAEKLCGRAAGREIMAEIAAHESESKLLDFKARKKYVQVIVKDSEGRDRALSLSNLKEPRRLVEYLAVRAFESKDLKRIRREVEKAVEAQHLHLKSEVDNARQALETTRRVTQDYREQFLGKSSDVPAPIFTPREVNAIEIYAIRHAGQKESHYYSRLVKEAEKEGRVVTGERGHAREREITDREGIEKPRSRPQSEEERMIGDAHAWVLQELRQGSQEDGLLHAPEEFVVSLSEKVRDGLHQGHGLSIQTLGYTREAWADAVLLHVRSALNNIAVGRESSALDQSVRLIDLIKQAIDRGDERQIARLSGRDPLSLEFELRERREQDFKQRGQDQVITQGQNLGSHERDESEGHTGPGGQENQVLDRLEHIFFR